MATEPTRPQGGILQLVSFELASELYGLDITAVQEIVRMPEITHIPGSPSYVDGVVNLRGKILPVIDLRKRFALAAMEATKRTRIIIVTIQDHTVGLIVDAVDQVLRLPLEALDPTPDLTTRGIEASCIQGIGKLEARLLILLELEQVLRGADSAVLALEAS